MRSCRLIYRSIAETGTLDRTALAQMVELSQANNDRLGIRGVLLMSGERFLQVLEGPVSFVNELYNKIVKDARHHDVQLVAYDNDCRGFFYDWSMRLIDLDAVPDAQREWLLAKYPHRDGVIEFPEDLMLVYPLLLDARLVGSG